MIRQRETATSTTIARARDDALATKPPLDLTGFIGESPAITGVFTIIAAVAPSTASVFITGESGTGKEIAAQAIHKSSTRRTKPFVALNCGAIPKDLIESELFGHIKGSFSGAVADRIGAIKHADGGTVFLDEICEMHIDLQSKLLRLLQSGTFTPVGSNTVDKANIRIVCATNRDPLAQVRAGQFREDLYYRLHVVPIHMPPLRERGDDVVLIGKALLTDFAKAEGKRFWKFNEPAKVLLRSYPWPGNVRQLQNVIHNAVLLNDEPEMTEGMLRMALEPSSAGAVTARKAPKEPATSRSQQGEPGIDPTTWRSAKDILAFAEIERLVMQRAIALCDGHIGKAAAHLGVSASTLYRKKQEWTASPLD